MSGSEVTIKSQPFKEIVVMEQTHFPTPDDMARFTSVIAGGKLAGLYWAEGVVFLYFPLPPTNAAVARMLIESGKVYWTFVGYALMPKYESTIETKEKMIVPVIDISSNPMLRRVAQWLKEPQASPKPCVHCGAENDENAKICSNCGKKLD